jgi:hypothetical protein
MVTDIAEKYDVSAQNPDVVKQLIAQIDIEAKKNGAAYSHFPLQIEPSKPAPSGNVIAINIEADAELSKQKLTLIDYQFPVLPECYLEYDMMIDTTAALSYTYLSLIKGESYTLESNGVNTDGKLSRLSPNKAGQWKRVSVGLCASAPVTLSKFGLGFKFKTKAKATVYIDNLCIKNMKGEVLHSLFVDELKKAKLVTKMATIVKLN